MAAHAIYVNHCNYIQFITKGEHPRPNQVVLTGNLGDDPSAHYTPEGLAITHFNFTFKSSAKKKEANWIKVSCFGKLAEVATLYLHKGGRIAIIGILERGGCLGGNFPIGGVTGEVQKLETRTHPLAADLGCRGALEKSILFPVPSSVSHSLDGEMILIRLRP